MSPATRLGDPCWTSEGAARAISPVAKVEDEARHYFLASHSPVEGVRNSRSGQVLDEQAIFSAVFTGALRSNRTHTVAVIWGSPGTGKSHLIHWLKLRLDAEQHGSPGILLPVLVKRRTGSLKDALEQIIGQLPERFSRYLTPLQSAVENISHAEARERLADEFAIQIVFDASGIKSSLPGRLRNLEEIFRSSGFRSWLCRNGGTIDRHVRRLIGLSNVDEREELPLFDSTDFLPSDRYRAKNSANVEDLIEEFEDEPRLRENAASLCNDLSRNAIQRMSGLRGSDLRAVLDSIRDQLHEDGQGLALFLEDVSVMNALDRDVVHAVEPGGGAKGKLVAVLGMTDAGLEKLADNERQRFDYEFSIESSVEKWRESQESVAAFAARYLNAARSDEGQLRRWAEGGIDGSPPPNACANCSVRDACHPAFGAIELHSAQGPLGLFPLSLAAPYNLLEALDTRQRAVRANPRGFLENILRRLLEEPDLLLQGRFPSLESMPVRIQEPPAWTEFDRRFLGAFSPVDKERVRTLATAWYPDSDADQLARKLQNILEPLRLPEFTSKVDPTRPPLAPSPTPTEGPRPAPPAPPSDELKRILSEFREWSKGAILRSDAEPRELVQGLLQESLPLEDVRGLPLAVATTLLRERGAILIEGQSSRRQQGRFSFSLNRSEETRALLEALTRRSRSTTGWSFPGGESHRRVVHLWLRRHGDRALAAMQPEGLNPQRPIRAAAQLLYIRGAAKRGEAPRGRQQVMETVFEPVSEESRLPRNAGHWKTLLDRIGHDSMLISEFLRDELAARQGTGAPIFLDPLPVLDAISEVLELSRVEEISAAFHSNYWSKRYASLVGAQKYPELAAALADQLRHARKLVGRCEEIGNDLGYSTESRPFAAKLAKDSLDLRDDLNAASNPIPDVEFDAAEPRLRAADCWDDVLQIIKKKSQGKTLGDLAEIHFPVLEEICDALCTVAAYLERVEAEVSAREGKLAEVDPADRSKLLQILDDLAALKIGS